MLSGGWCQLTYYIDPLVEIDTKGDRLLGVRRGPVFAGRAVGGGFEEAMFPGAACRRDRGSGRGHVAGRMTVVQQGLRSQAGGVTGGWGRPLDASDRDGRATAP